MGCATISCSSRTRGTSVRSYGACASVTRTTTDKSWKWCGWRPRFSETSFIAGKWVRAWILWFHADDPDTVLGPRQLSDGTLRFICLSTLLLQPVELQSELILIDEPELGLHPYAITLLAEMFQHAGDSRQVIASTQSADLVSELNPEDVVVVERKEGASTFRRLDRDDLRDWLEDYALGELWKMNILGGRPVR